MTTPQGSEGDLNAFDEPQLSGVTAIVPGPNKAGDEM